MPGISRRDYEMAAESRGRAMDRIHDTLAQRNQQKFQAGMQQRQADLNLRNQTLINQQQEEEQIRSERRELAEIQRQKAEWSFGDKTTDFLIKAGDYPRINEKMAQDSEFANEFSTIMKDESSDWGQKTRAIYAAEAAASQRIAVKQKYETPIEMMKKNQFVLDMADYGGSGKIVVMPNGKGGFIMNKVEEGGLFRDIPQGGQSAGQQQIPFGPMVPQETPYPGAPVPIGQQQGPVDFGFPPPKGYTGPDPILKEWAPGMEEKYIEGLRKRWETLTEADFSAMASNQRYMASKVRPEWNPEMQAAHAIAVQHQEEERQAKLLKLKGTGGGEKEKPGIYESESALAKEFQNVKEEYNDSTKRDAFLDREMPSAKQKNPWYLGDTETPLTDDTLWAIAAKRLRDNQGQVNKNMGTVRPQQSPATATPGMTPTPTSPMLDLNRDAQQAEANMKAQIQAGLKSLLDAGVSQPEAIREMEVKFGVKINP